MHQIIYNAYSTLKDKHNTLYNAFRLPYCKYMFYIPNQKQNTQYAKYQHDILEIPVWQEQTLLSFNCQKFTVWHKRSIHLMNQDTNNKL